MTEILRQHSEAFEAEERKRYLAALEQAVERLRGRGRDPEAYTEAGRCLVTLRRYEEAIGTLREGIEQCPESPRLYLLYIQVLNELNRTAEAIEIARAAQLKFPSASIFKLKGSLILPRLYQDSDEIELARRRFTEGLRKIAGELRLDTRDARGNALGGLDGHVNFLLAYQGFDDRQLQRLYGEMAHRIMAANYPHWVQPLHMPPDHGTLRIGYISAQMRHHSVSKTHLQWMLEHKRERFQVFGYHVGTETDYQTEAARRGSARFRHLPGGVEDTCRAILSDELHCLVFLDIGMNPRMTQLAALRLAPVQCATWGHPVTSGLPTIDYFFSSELMEPEEAQNYYTEKLICLPGIGICYPRPTIPTVLFYRKRADFGLRDDAIVYLSCQALFKYLPQHDDVFPAIAKLVPTAQFVFIGKNDALRRDLGKRLDRAFAAAGVQASLHVVFVPPLDQLNYWNLNILSDIYLDTIEWSGCNSTFEAIACKLPVVTLPGRFMRGRHSYAILTQLGVTGTIARDKPSYVEIAARLGLDPAWRKHVVQSMVAGYPRVYSDKRSIRALEDFYEQIASGMSSSPSP